MNTFETYEEPKVIIDIPPKNVGGRPTEYSATYIDAVDAYLETCVDTYVTIEGIGKRLKVKLPTIEGFAKYLGVARSSIFLWMKEYKEFSDSVDRITAEQKQRILESGLSGEYNSAIGKLVLSANHDMKEKSEKDLTHKGRVHLGDILDDLDEEDGEVDFENAESEKEPE